MILPSGNTINKNFLDELIVRSFSDPFDNTKKCSQRIPNLFVDRIIGLIDEIQIEAKKLSKQQKKVKEQVSNEEVKVEPTPECQDLKKLIDNTTEMTSKMLLEDNNSTAKMMNTEINLPETSPVKFQTSREPIKSSIENEAILDSDYNMIVEELMVDVPDMSSMRLDCQEPSSSYHPVEQSEGLSLKNIMIISQILDYSSSMNSSGNP